MENIICEYSGLLSVAAYDNDICPIHAITLTQEGECIKCLEDNNK